MLPYFGGAFGNPSSRGHRFGWDADRALQTARERVASLVNATPGEIVFTSGATEANLLAIHGAGAGEADRRHVVSSPIEHRSVLAALDALAERGFTITWVQPGADGRTAWEDVLAAVRPDTRLVSLMWVNNEIGVVNPIPTLALRLKALFPHVLLHTDATQALGKLPVDVQAAPIDLLSASAHKLYGPKGVGALYVRSAVEGGLRPVMRGGGQERGLRGGTPNVPGIVGFGKACELARDRLDSDTARITALTRRLFERLADGSPDLVLHGSESDRVPGNLSVAFPGLRGDALIKALGERVALSSGSACSAGSADVSHVLRGIGVPDDLARATLRFGIGRGTTEQEVDLAADAVLEAIGSLRGAAPTPEPSPAEELRLRPIGSVENGITEPAYIEWRKVVSRIRVAPEWAAALEGLDGYSHVVVLFWMHQVSTCKLTHVPQANYAEVPEVGMFACRCPYRPNPIAATTVRLLAIDGLELTVQGLDAVDGTPVIDLKPYTPQMDAVEGEVRVPAWVDRLVY